AAARPLLRRARRLRRGRAVPRGRTFAPAGPRASNALKPGGGTMQSIAVINQKGGVGKTTTTVNLGAALSRRGYRVLLLDMDPQANLTVHVDKRPDLEGQTLTNLLVEDEPLATLVQPTSMPRLFVVPSD